MLGHEDLPIGASPNFLDEAVVMGDGLLPDFDHVLQIKHAIRPEAVFHRFDGCDSHN